ncbi:hypothetical protein, partial [Xanthomonas oryzae]|uniref:hypothetical protein n=1 Tax=Xanthomonas oryzae TaxID=347 RepID=UPI0019D37A16
ERGFSGATNDHDRVILLKAALSRVRLFHCTADFKYKLTNDTTALTPNGHDRLTESSTAT